MRTCGRRIRSALLTLVIALGLCAPLGGPARAEEADIIAEGSTSTQGEVHWTLDSGGTLTIRGEGRPPAVSPSMVITPWGDYAGQIRRVVIEDGITSTGEYSFAGCTNLTEVELASTVTRINRGAFRNCTGLTSIQFPEGLVSVESSAFSGCTGLTELDLPAGCNTIGSWAFSGCTGLEELCLPDSVTGIGTQAFLGCTGLTRVVLPSGIGSMGQSAFGNCPNLTEVYWPLSLASADQYFHNSGSLTVYYEGSQEDWDSIGVPYLGQKVPEGAEIRFNCEMPSQPDGESQTGADIPVPALREVSATGEGVRLSWYLPLDVPGYETDAYRILRRTGDGGYVQIGEVPGTASSFTDTDVVSGQTYTYTVQACRQGSAGGYDETGLTITWTGALSIAEVDISGGYSMLPLEGSSDVTLTLAEPLPQRYLRDGQFAGSVRLVAGETLLASDGQVEYEPAYQDLYAVLSPGAGEHFPPNTQAELQVLDEAGNVVASAPCRTYFQQWAAPNFDAADAPVPQRLIYLMLWDDGSTDRAYDTRADQLVGQGAEPGRGGFCFGMALSVSLVNWLGTYEFGAYDILDETGDSAQALAQVAMEGEFTGFNAVEFIQMCHVAQYLRPVQQELEENRWDYAGLLREIDRYQAGECPMPLAWISSSGDGDDKSSHVLGAFDYRIEGEDAYILCYDCNLPGVRKELKLSGYRNAGAAWSFETLGWSGSEGGNSKNYFTYYTPEGESSLFIYAQQAGPDVLLSAADADALDQATAAGGLKLTSISCLADAGSLSGGLAWLSGDGTLSLTGEEEITLADRAAAYRITEAESWSSTLTGGTVAELSARGDGVRLSWEYYAESGDRVAASFAGGPDAGENPVTIRRDGDSLSISGGAGGAVTVTYESGESWTVEVKTDAPLTITADGENAPSSTDDGLPFSDVDPGAWYADAVAWAVERGITTGTSATAFSPDRPCTRAEIVTMIWRTLGLDGLSAPTGDNPFRDVDEDAWYYEAVLWAAQNGITTGTSADTFSPDAVCTRAEVVTFLWRVDFPPKQLTGTPAFKDVFRGDYFWFPVIWALDREITTGTSADTFSPHLLCTRAQVVTFLYRDFKDSV